MDPDSNLPVVLSVVALLATNAFFVIAEYALLAPQRARSDSLVRESEGRSSRLVDLVRPEEVLLLAQVGRSFSSLALGYGAVQIGATLTAPGARFDAATIFLTLAVAALIHAVFSAQVPKLVGIHHPNGRIADLVVAPLRLLALLFLPILRPLAYLVRMFARWVGVSMPVFQTPVHTSEEIRELVSQGHQQGVVEEDEREMIHGVLEFSETVAREVMTPRIDIIAVPVGAPLEEILELVIQEGHSRLPVYEGSIDTVVGVLLAKDLLPFLAHSAADAREDFDITSVMRQPYFVPDTKPVDDILAELRRQSVHLAIVLDEFGGTYGLLTMEDLLEEIVGEINDEYDVAEEEFSATPEGDVLIDGGASLSEVNERFGLSLPEEDFDTLGGYIFGTLGRIPMPGDEIAGSGDEPLVLHVEEIEDRRVTRVRLTRGAQVEQTVPES